MTGGCLPMIVQMIILFGIISVIYMPLKHLAHMPDTVINASVDAMQNPLMEDGKTEDTSAGKLPRGRFTGYYKELYMMKNLETYKTDVLANIEKVAPGESQKYYDEMIELRSQFDFFGRTLLDNPFEGGFKGINILWLIPLFSGLTGLGLQHYLHALHQNVHGRPAAWTGLLQHHDAGDDARFLPLHHLYGARRRWYLLDLF